MNLQSPSPLPWGKVVLVVLVMATLALGSPVFAQKPSTQAPKRDLETILAEFTN